MHTIGVYLILAAVVLRTTVVLSDASAFPIILILLTAYGLILFGETWLLHSNRLRVLPPAAARPLFLALQSLLAIGLLIAASYEDFLALLLVPLSLHAVSYFGRQTGYRIISILCLSMSATFLFSDEGPLFGLAMAALYSGVCFLFGGYAHQVHKARMAHEENEQRLNELGKAHGQLEGYTDQLASLAVEHERNRLARELHDSVTQTVFSMNLAAQSAYLLFTREPAQAAGQLQRIDKLAASAQREIQSLVSQLTPTSVIHEDLAAALHRLVLEQQTRSGLQVSLEICGAGMLAPAVVTNLYSIAHEALRNVSKHGETCEAVVRLNFAQGRCSLEIEDHGKGFNPNAVLSERGHLGLAGMVERAHEIRWNLSVQSRPGEGTRICVSEGELKP